MLTDQHAQPPPDHESPPCDCGGCREFRAIHAGFSLEVPLPERLAKRETDRTAQHRFDMTAFDRRRAA